VSLRTQIHSAFDEVAPPTHGLPERVVQTVLKENAGRRRRERLMLRLRVPLSLVAVFVLVALVVGVLIGGRLMQDWNSFHNSAPAGGVTGTGRLAAAGADVTTAGSGGAMRAGRAATHRQPDAGKQIAAGSVDAVERRHDISCTVDPGYRSGARDERAAKHRSRHRAF